MSNLEDHEREQEAITAAWEASHLRTNRVRAAEAQQICELMERMTGVDDLRSQVADALAHLMHLCRLYRDEDGDVIDFDECLATGRMNFEAECVEDPDDDPYDLHRAEL
jgi:hypothetical protein